MQRGYAVYRLQQYLILFLDEKSRPNQGRLLRCHFFDFFASGNASCRRYFNPVSLFLDLLFRTAFSSASPTVIIIAFFLALVSAT